MTEQPTPPGPAPGYPTYPTGPGPVGPGYEPPMAPVPLGPRRATLGTGVVVGLVFALVGIYLTLAAVAFAFFGSGGGSYVSDRVTAEEGTSFTVDDDFEVEQGWSLEKVGGSVVPHGSYTVSDEWDYTDPRVTFVFLANGKEVDHATCATNGSLRSGAHGTLDCAPAKVGDYDRIRVSLRDD